MKYIYEIINIPWFNSTVDVWPEGQPEEKERFVVFNLRGPGGTDEKKLIDFLKAKYEVEEVEVELAT